MPDGPRAQTRRDRAPVPLLGPEDVNDGRPAASGELHHGTLSSGESKQGCPKWGLGPTFLIALRLPTSLHGLGVNSNIHDGESEGPTSVWGLTSMASWHHGAHSGSLGDGGRENAQRKMHCRFADIPGRQEGVCTPILRGFLASVIRPMVISLAEGGDRKEMPRLALLERG